MIIGSIRRTEKSVILSKRQCGKGPNLRFDGKLYNGADEALLHRLAEEAKKA